MALGRFQTNMTADCTQNTLSASLCGQKISGSFTTYCAKHQPASYWMSREEGPPAPWTNGYISPDDVGVYEKLPGPAGQWAPGFDNPQIVGLPNVAKPKSIPPIPSLNYTPSKSWWTTPATPTAQPVSSVAAHAKAVTASGINSNVNKLKAIREDGDNSIAKKFDPSCLLEPMGCKACGSQEKNRHKLMCPQDPARKKTVKWS